MKGLIFPAIFLYTHSFFLTTVEMQRRLSIIISAKYSELEILDFLSGRFSYLTRNQWQSEIRAGRILLNHKQVISCHEMLESGDQLVYLFTELAEPAVKDDFSILYEDKDIMVVDKPGNLPCHPGGRYFRHTLWAMLKQHYESSNLSFVNRLDRETSGLVLLAKNKTAAKICSKQFADNSVYKRYLVLVEGEFSKHKLIAQGFLSNDLSSPVRKKMCFQMEGGACVISSKAQECRTTFCMRQKANGISLLEAVPQTGRLHQIRATLCSLGFPVVGDKLYGLDDGLFLRFISDDLTPQDHSRLRMERQALHAETLRIHHPQTGRELTFFSPMPVEFHNFLLNSKK